MLPQPVYARMRRLYRSRAEASRERRLAAKVAAAPAEPEWLDPETLGGINSRYPVNRGYGYDPETLRERGAERSAELFALLGSDSERAGDFLELGANDAMVGAAICEKGGRATAVDLEDARDERAVAAGVAFAEADAAALPFEAESFDVVYSYNAFEHLAQPDQALFEALRVLRPGGSIYLSFGPLYCAPFGLHAYYDLGVPYCQFLWEPSVIEAFISAQGAPALDYVNGWSLESYRALWQTAGAEIREYRELRDRSGIDVIDEFPSCFKKAPSLDSLLVGQIEILMAKSPERATRQAAGTNA